MWIWSARENDLRKLFCVSLYVLQFSGTRAFLCSLCCWDIVFVSANLHLFYTSVVCSYNNSFKTMTVCGVFAMCQWLNVLAFFALWMKHLMRTRISSICQRKKYVICFVSVHIGGIVAKVRLHVIQISKRTLVHVDDHLGNGNKTRQNLFTKCLMKEFSRKSSAIYCAPCGPMSFSLRSSVCTVDVSLF